MKLTKKDIGMARNINSSLITNDEGRIWNETKYIPLFRLCEVVKELKSKQEEIDEDPDGNSFTNDNWFAVNIEYIDEAFGEIMGELG